MGLGNVIKCPRFGQDVESAAGKVEVEQTWTDDDIVTHLRLVVRTKSESQSHLFISGCSLSSVIDCHKCY